MDNVGLNIEQKISLGCGLKSYMLKSRLQNQKVNIIFMFNTELIKRQLALFSKSYTDFLL